MRQLKISQQITNRETRSLDRYFVEVARVDLVTADEEVQLARRIQDGDGMALEKLTKANLRFVISVAKQYQHLGLSLGDLINEGNFGLIKAAKRFDASRGFKFISYAVWWIRQSILQSLSEQARIVRLPLNRVNALNKMLKTSAVLEQIYQREPTSAELADQIGVDVEEMNRTQRSFGRHISYNAPISEGESDSLLELMEDKEALTPDDGLLRESLRADVQRAMSQLPGREAEVMNFYFGLNGENPMSLDELGSRMNLTSERVRQLKEKATRRLRTLSSRNGGLKFHL